jgi:hypothetical protein
VAVSGKSLDGQRKTKPHLLPWVATCCRDGKEGVYGSSPSEGFAVQPAISAFLLSALTLVCCFGVHATSTSVHGSVRVR